MNVLFNFKENGIYEWSREIIKINTLMLKPKGQVNGKTTRLLLYQKINKMCRLGLGYE